MVPEIIDAIRAMASSERDARASIGRMERSLGAVKGLPAADDPRGGYPRWDGEGAAGWAWQYVDEGCNGSEEPTAPEFTEAQRSREEREDR